LSIDSATCTISGVPTEVRALSVYTVTAKNATDDDIAPPELLKVMSVMAESVVAIWSAPVVFVRLGAGAFTVKEKLALSVLSVAFITNITFNNSGGAIASCTAAPTLPAGLSINSTTCTISGTPTEVRARTVYTVTVRALTSVGVPLMVQVALSILKPAGSVGATVQLTIAPPELLKVMSVMAESVVAIWSVVQ
jgi:hypothetical protein